MKLVEIIPHEETPKEIPLALKVWFENKGKKPAQCKDAPGFIVNRVARSFYGEPLHSIPEDLKDSEKAFREADHILKEVGGFRMGAFELMDLIGIDINYSVTQIVWNAYHQSPRFRPHPLQEEKVASQCLGRKTQRGFYSYE